MRIFMENFFFFFFFLRRRLAIVIFLPKLKEEKFFITWFYRKNGNFLNFFRVKLTDGHFFLETPWTEFFTATLLTIFFRFAPRHPK